MTPDQDDRYPVSPDNGREEDFLFEPSELDQRILELNEEGHSANKISKLLKDRHGIRLSGRNVSRHLLELRQLFNVKVNYKTPKRSKENDRWYKIILELQEYIPKYTQDNGFKPSVRTAFYDFQDLHRVKKHEFGRFDSVTVKARLGYRDANGDLVYPKLDIDCFADDDSRKVLQRYDDSEPQEPEDPGPIPDADNYIQDCIDDFKHAVYNYTGQGEKGADGEIGGFWYGQPEYVEVWQEKNDLLDGFDTLLEDVYVNIRSNKGFSSLAFLDRCCDELKEVIEGKQLEQEHVWIGYCGDWDPSGEHMLYYIKKRLTLLGLPRVNVERIAVTPEQIDEYNLPLMSIDPEPGKRPDPNMREFRRRYGDKATHLNAFFTQKHIHQFKEILVSFIKRHWNEEIYNQMVEDYDVEAEAPDGLTQEELKEVRGKMCKQITDAFKPGWENELNWEEDSDDA